MDKYLLKFIKDILPSSKYSTGIRHMSHRDYSTSIRRENILSIELVLKLDTTTSKSYYKSSASDEDILGCRKDTVTRHRLLSLLIISDSHDIFIS